MPLSADPFLGDPPGPGGPSFSGSTRLERPCVFSLRSERGQSGSEAASAMSGLVDGLRTRSSRVSACPRTRLPLKHLGQRLLPPTPWALVVGPPVLAGVLSGAPRLHPRGTAAPPGRGPAFEEPGCAVRGPAAETALSQAASRADLAVGRGRGTAPEEPVSAHDVTVESLGFPRKPGRSPSCQKPRRFDPVLSTQCVRTVHSTVLKQRSGRASVRLGTPRQRRPGQT